MALSQVCGLPRRAEQPSLYADRLVRADLMDKASVFQHALHTYLLGPLYQNTTPATQRERARASLNNLPTNGHTHPHFTKQSLTEKRRQYDFNLFREML